MNVNPVPPSGVSPVPPQSAGEGAPQQNVAASPQPNDAAVNAPKDQPPVETQEASAAAKSDSAQAKPAPTQAPAASQVEVSDILSGKLSELTKTITARASLISSLPENIQAAIKDIFRQGALTENNLPEGLANLLKSQNIANKQLTVLANLLDDASRLSNENQGNVKLTQLLEKLFPDKLTNSTAAEQQKLPAEPGQKLVDTLTRLNNQDISPNQLRQTLQSLAGELLSQNASLPKGAQQLPQLLFGQNASPMPPEIAKLAETVKQPDITLLWTLLQSGQKENKSLSPEQAQQRLLELANQLTKDQPALSAKNAPAPNPVSNPASAQPSAATAQSQQTIQQILPSLLTNEETKLLELGSLLKNIAGQNAASAPPLLMQMAKDANMPQLLQLWNLTQTLTAGSSGSNFTLATATTLEQNLNQLASNLLSGNISSSEAKSSLDILMGSFKGFDKFEATEEQLAKNLLRQTMTSLPPQIGQAAAKHNMPELSRAWMMTRLANLDACREQEAAELKLAAANIRTLSSAMQRSSVTHVIEHQSGNSVLSLTTPLYFGDGQAYPAHIHIYQEYADGGSPAARRRNKPETWVRITVDTENIGPVDTFFRLYDQGKLDVRVRFQEHATASEFGEYLPEIRRAMKDSALELTDLSVRSSNS